MKVKEPDNNCEDFGTGRCNFLMVHVLIKGGVNLLFVDFLNLQKYMRIVWLRLLFVSVSVVHLCMYGMCVLVLMDSRRRH